MTEFFAEPLVAWRLWQVRPHADEYRLESLTWHHVGWPAGERLEATCATHRGDAPTAGHECGIHALKTRELAEELLRRYAGVRRCYHASGSARGEGRRQRPIALGRVSLWGRILERERGFRAQYAYPYDLFLVGGDDRIADVLRRRYAVDASAG